MLSNTALSTTDFPVAKKTEAFKVQWKRKSGDGDGGLTASEKTGLALKLASAQSGHLAVGGQLLVLGKDGDTFILTGETAEQAARKLGLGESSKTPAKSGLEALRDELLASLPFKTIEVDAADLAETPSTFLG